MLRAVVEEARSRVEALASMSTPALIVSVSPEASPMVLLPVTLNVPSTVSVAVGFVVPIPTLPPEGIIPNSPTLEVKKSVYVPLLLN